MSELVEAAISYVTELFGTDATGHDVGHALRVWRNAMMIVDGESAVDREVVALAAILHDVDDHKLFDTTDDAHARAFLAAQGVSGDKVDLICDVIDAVSFSRNRGRRPRTIEGMVVQDADRLDAIGAIGIARTFAYGGAHGRPLASSIEHFHAKLLLLKDEMNTAGGRELAEGRHAFLVDYLARVEEETQGLL